MTPEYIEAPALAEIVTNETQRAKVLVIDVRSLDERREGHVAGSRHISSDRFLDALPALRKELTSETCPYSVVVTHCALSQVRGPKAARRLLDALEDAEHRPTVKVLRLGFEGWLDQDIPRQFPGSTEGM